MDSYIDLADKILIPVIIALVSYLVARRQIINTGVTQFRQQWIEDLRESVSTFIAKAEVIAMIDLDDDELYFEHFQELSEAQNRVELMLNSNEEDHKNVVDAMVVIRDIIHDAKVSEKKLAKRLDAGNVKLISATKKVLKSEWVRVKSGE